MDRVMEKRWLILGGMKKKMIMMMMGKKTGIFLLRDVSFNQSVFCKYLVNLLSLLQLVPLCSKLRNLYGYMLRSTDTSKKMAYPYGYRYSLIRIGYLFLHIHN